MQQNNRQYYQPPSPQYGQPQYRQQQYQQPQHQNQQYQNPQYQVPVYTQPQPVYMPPVTPQPVLTPEEKYRKTLRKEANGLGRLLIYFVIAELLFSNLLLLILDLVNIQSSLTENSMLEMLSSSVFSAVIFFMIGCIYALAHKKSFAGLFPFEKVKAADYTKLVVIGLLLNLMSNYVVEMVYGTFGLFGIEGSGALTDTDSVPSALMYMISVSLIPALTEEFAFRGVILGSLRQYSDGLAVVVSSVVFALLHGNFQQIPFTFCCGLVFGFLAVKTNSLLPSIIVHMLNNGLAAGSELLISYNIVDNNGANLIYSVIYVVLGILSIIFIIGYIRKDENFFKLEKANDVIPYKAKLTTIASSPTMISFAAIMTVLTVSNSF